MKIYKLTKTIVFLIVLISICNLSIGQKRVILDTDPSADPDDVGCMAMLHNMATQGACEILAVMNSTHFKQSSLSISAINMFYNRSGIPVGDYKGYTTKLEGDEANYDYHLARVYPRSIKTWNDALDGVLLYREILASAEDKSITIVIIGTMHNFYDLLRSDGDQFSTLNGVELVEKKVQQVVTMGGNFIDGKGYDRTNWGGSDTLCAYTNWSCLNRERNTMCRYVIENCPCPFVASGWEVGCGDYFDAGYGNVITGQGLKNLDPTHILRRSYEYHFLARGETKDIRRHSNDQCALHYAIRGERNNYKAYTDGKITLSESGDCFWDSTTNRNQGFIQKKRDKDSIASEIEHLMMMEELVVDITPPTVPMNVEYDHSANPIVWDASIDTTIGSWVVGYNIYHDDNYLTTAYGTQLIVDSVLIRPEMKLEIRACNSSGIESESNWITVE